MQLRDPDSTHETLSVRITGKVQGVGYRAATVRAAHQFRVRGWVRNADDGSVEALIQGQADQVDRMLTWLRHGPPAARVVDVTLEEIQTERHFDRFEQI